MYIVKKVVKKYVDLKNLDRFYFYFMEKDTKNAEYSAWKSLDIVVDGNCLCLYLLVQSTHLVA